METRFGVLPTFVLVVMTAPLLSGCLFSSGEKTALTDLVHEAPGLTQSQVHELDGDSQLLSRLKRINNGSGSVSKDVASDWDSETIHEVFEKSWDAMGWACRTWEAGGSNILQPTIDQRAAYESLRSGSNGGVSKEDIDLACRMRESIEHATG
jgi:hypothetical protein